MGDLQLTPEEFSKLPQRDQLTVLYKTIRRDTIENSRQRWVIRGLLISQAAQWTVIIWMLNYVLR